MSEQNEVNAEIAGNKFSAKNLPLNWLAIIGILFVSAGSLWMLVEHKAEAKQDKSELVSVLREMNTTNKELVQTQRITNCIISLPPDRRETALSTCERIAR